MTTKPSRDPDYKVVCNADLVLLRIEIVELMRDGWRPCGGVAVVIAESIAQACCYQAMAKDR